MGLRVREDLSGYLLKLFASLVKSANDLRLTIAANIAVAGERCHDVIVPKALLSVESQFTLGIVVSSNRVAGV
jgi:hypothetical protein